MMATEHIPSSSTLIRGCHRAGAGQCCPDLCKPSRPALPLTLLVWWGQRDPGPDKNLRSSQPKSLVQILYSCIKMVLITHSHCQAIFHGHIYFYTAGFATAIWQLWSRWLELVPGAAGAGAAAGCAAGQRPEPPAGGGGRSVLPRRHTPRHTREQGRRGRGEVAQVKYGGRSSKFIWAPCHVMCTAVRIG